jgi:hypothetical protein
MAKGSALKELLARKRADQQKLQQSLGLSDADMRRRAAYIPPEPAPGREQRRDAFGERYYHGSRQNQLGKSFAIEEFMGQRGVAGHFTKDPEFARLFSGSSKNQLSEAMMDELQPGMPGADSPLRGKAGATYPVRLNISDTFDANDPSHYDRIREYVREANRKGNMDAPSLDYLEIVDDVERSFQNGSGDHFDLELINTVLPQVGFDSYLDFEYPRGSGEVHNPTGVAVFDSKNIRSEFANFDEAQRESGNILAGIVPIGGATGLTLAALQSGEAEASARFPERIRGMLDPLPGQPLNAQGRPISQPNIPGRGIVEIGPNERAIKAADNYARSSNIPYVPLESYAPLDRERARRIAREYDLMKHAPQDKDVLRSYNAMIDETMGQYEAMLSQGVKPFFIRGKDPYAASPYYALIDLAENNRLGVFPTDEGFGTLDDFDPADNPLLAPTEFKLDGETMLANDVFRAVHDYYGHAKPGVGFRAMGEENAYQSHAGMYSPLARRALASETRGQNSWLNFGPYGDTNRTAGIEDTVFADQKTGLMPRWAAESGRVTAHDRRNRFEAARRENRTGLEGAIDSDGNVSLVHFSRKPLDRIDPDFYGQGLSGRTRAEVNRAADPDFTKRSYFGLETDERPYRRESGLGSVRNEAQIEGELLYPVEEDPEGLRAMGGTTTEIENRIADANYSGYTRRHPALGTVAAMFDPLDTRKLSGVAAGIGAGALATGSEETEAAGLLAPRRNLLEVPDVDQFALERYQPPRGRPKTLDRLITPEAERRLTEYAKQGMDRGGAGWYNTEALREEFINELGPEQGAERFARYMDIVSATSPKSNVAANIRRASELYRRDMAGEPIAGVKLPPGYGHLAAKTHDASLRDLENSGSFASITRPKTSSFSQNLQGNQRPMTIDTHNMAAIAGDPTFKQSPSQTQYGFLEDWQSELGDKLGLTPAQWQSSVWVGADDITGVDDSRPFLEVFDDLVDRTARRDGVEPEEALSNFIQGRSPLFQMGGAAVLGGAALAPDDAEAAQYYHGARIPFDQLDPNKGEGTLYATPDPAEASEYAGPNGAVYPINIDGESQQLMDEDFRMLRDKPVRLEDMKRRGVDYVTTDDGDQIAILNNDRIRFAAETGEGTAPEGDYAMVDGVPEDLLGPQYDTPRTAAAMAGMAALAPQEGMTRDEKVNLGLQMAGAIPEAMAREIVGGAGMLATGERNEIYDSPILDLTPAQDRAVSGALEPVGDALRTGIDAAGEAGYNTTTSILETPIAPGYKVGDALMDAEETISEGWESLSDSAKNRLLGALAVTGVLDVTGGLRGISSRLFRD